MKQKLALILTFVLLAAALSGCAGTTVVVGNCTCPPEVHVQAPAPAETQAPAAPEPPAAPAAPAEGALKTGLAIVTDLTDNINATDTDGQAKFDATIVAVAVDENGIIQACLLDSLNPAVSFDTTGAITSDVTAAIQTKNELGEAYGMKAYAGSKFEWNEQAAAVAAYAVGKTTEQLKTMAVDETGHAADADLATTATIYIGGYVDTIVKAVENAQSLGAQAGDELKLAIIPSLASSTSASAEQAGNAQLDCDVAVITMKDGVITSCLIDALQAKVPFDTTGAITADPPAVVPTKNELGEAYGMKAYAGSQYEWNEQAANFSAYITGKTPADVAGIAVAEGKAADADLAAGVSIAIGGFQALIAKAAQ